MGVAGKYGIMSPDIIPARSEAEWPSLRSAMSKTWYNVARHYTGPERSGVAIPAERNVEDMV